MYCISYTASWMLPTYTMPVSSRFSVYSVAPAVQLHATIVYYRCLSLLPISITYDDNLRWRTYMVGWMCMTHRLVCWMVMHGIWACVVGERAWWMDMYDGWTCMMYGHVWCMDIYGGWTLCDGWTCMVDEHVRWMRVYDGSAGMNGWRMWKRRKRARRRKLASHCGPRPLVRHFFFKLFWGCCTIWHKMAEACFHKTWSVIFYVRACKIPQPFERLLVVIMIALVACGLYQLYSLC